MTKGVFFDWYGTLAHYDPPSAELQARACHDFGVDVTPELINRGFPAADQYFYEENASSPMDKRSPQEQARVYSQYETLVLKGAGIEVDKKASLAILAKVRQLAEGTRFALFTDVLPTLKVLKDKSLVLGMISNIVRDMHPVCQQLGLDPYLDFIITSVEVGADKPQPPIFWAALERAGVEAAEAIHVGDQYLSDVIGAQRVGMKALLLDRDDLFPDISDCTRIYSLTGVLDYL